MFCDRADGLMEGSGRGTSTDGHSDSRWTSEASARQMGQVRLAWRRQKRIKWLNNTEIHLIIENRKINLGVCSNTGMPYKPQCHELAPSSMTAAFSQHCS